MKYPNPTFLTKASDIRQKRHTKIVIAIVLAVVIALFVAFVLWGARMQQIYKENYPDMVGAATRVTIEETTTETTESSPVTEESTEATTEEVILAPVVNTEETTTTTEATSQVNFPDTFEEYEPVYFYTEHPLQSVSHEERDMMLDVLKQQVQDYININSNETICFRYVNLASNETLGINDLNPIIPAGAFALPIEMVYCQRVNTGFIYPLSTVTYMGEAAPGGQSYIADTYEAGKQFYIRTIANLAVIRNDNIALSYLLTKIGGMERIWPSIAQMSSYINYTEDVTYTNSHGDQIRGDSRTSCYDMGEYASALYFGYISHPDIYQTLINDLYHSEMPTAYSIAFGEDALVFHVSGRNEESNSYTDVAIIDCEEPIVLVISSECANYNRAYEIETILAGYVAQYIASCHTN